jgi:hypothetical protein
MSDDDVDNGAIIEKSAPSPPPPVTVIETSPTDVATRGEVLLGLNRGEFGFF